MNPYICHQIMPKIPCPNCSHTRSWRLRRGKRKCKKCRREFNPIHYPVSGFRLTEEVWRSCIGIFLRERTIGRIVTEIGLGHSTVEKIVRHLRAAMAKSSLPLFYGPVELDETYIGGQRKNKRLHIRRIQGKRGHGTDKLAIMGIFDRNSGLVYVEVIPKLDLRRIFEIVRARVPRGARIYSDGFKMYRSFTHQGFIHCYVDHAGGEYVRGDVHTNNIEGFWGILKRKMSCIGGMRRDKLHTFVDEIVWRFNHRGLSLAEQEDRLFDAIRDQ